MRLWPLGVVLVLLRPSPAVAVSEYHGLVVSVLGGDTLEVLHNQHPERIRLSGIDCPEKGQAFGKRAKQAASEFAYGKEVTLLTHGLDKYGRTLADVLCPMEPTSITRWSKTLVLVVENHLLGSRLYRFFPLRMGFNTAWSLRRIVPTQNSRTCAY